jgi:hypothetical protein
MSTETDDRDVITETEVDTDGLYLSDDELQEQAADWDYWQEVRDCCGAGARNCIHWISHPPPIERD